MSCRVCSDFHSWSHGGAQEQTKLAQSSKRESSNKKGDGDSAGYSFTKPDVDTEKSQKTVTKLECPPGYKELANSTWTFLHTTAAYYPENPTHKQQELMRHLISAVSVLYPCQPCAEHMREEIIKDPPRVESQPAISLWLCRFHNTVNEMLGKRIFDCSKTNERWRDGPKDGSCD